MSSATLETNSKQKSGKSQLATTKYRHQAISKRKQAMGKLLEQHMIIVSFTPPPMEVDSIREYSYTSYPICPCCGMTMEREYQLHCDRCGQPLAWNHFNSLYITCIK